MTTDSSMTFEDGTYITRQQMELMYEVRILLLLLDDRRLQRAACCGKEYKCLVTEEQYFALRLMNK